MSPRAAISGGHLTTVAEALREELGAKDAAAMCERFAARTASFKVRAFWLAVAERVREDLPYGRKVLRGWL